MNRNLKIFLFILLPLLFVWNTTGVNQCSETDKGQDYLKRGTTTDQTYGSWTDSCIDNDVLREYFCSGNTQYRIDVSCSTIYGSDYICQNGACVKQGQGGGSSGGNQDTCTDSDNGKDPYTKGTVIDKDPDGSYFQASDFCINNGRTVKEYYCSGNDFSSTYINCGANEICQNGACVKQGGSGGNSRQCSETDFPGQDQLKVRGTTTKGNISKTDYCDVNTGELIEYTCYQGNIWELRRNCSAWYGDPNMKCINGACSIGTRNGSNNNQKCQQIIKNNGTKIGQYLATYDTNNNKKIDNQEFYKITDDWVAGKIPDQDYFLLIDFWNNSCVFQGGGGSGKCSETDNGNDIFNKGNVTDKYGNTGTDYCDASSGNLVEYFCDSNGNLANQSTACPSGYVCQNGACVKQGQGGGSGGGSGGNNNCTYSDIIKQYDQNGDKKIDLDELGNAAIDYSRNKITLKQYMEIQQYFLNGCGGNGGNGKLKADFYWIPEKPKVNEEFKVIDNSTGNIVNRTWSVFFSDKIVNITGKKKITITMYSGPSVKVKLKVMDDKGNSDEVVKRIFVESNPSPLIDFSVKKSQNPMKFIFDASSSRDDGRIVKYSWYFFDGFSSDKISFEREFPRDGIYPFTLFLEDDFGNKVGYYSQIGINADSETLPYTYELMQLTPGWNSIYVSSKGKIPLKSLDCGNIIAIKLKDGKLSAENEFLEGGKAYLIRVTESCSVKSNVKKEDNAIILQKGWNFIGFDRNVKVEELKEKCPYNPIIIGLSENKGMVNGNSVGGKLYSERDIMEKGIGYFVRVNNVCSLQR